MSSRQSPDIYWHAELCFRWPWMTDECILWWPSSNHHKILYFCMFYCIAIIRRIETFWKPCTCCLENCNKWQPFSLMNNIYFPNFDPEKVSLHLIITIHKVTSNVQSVPLASLQTFIDKPNCVIDDRVQYSTFHIPNVFCDGHLQIIIKYCIFVWFVYCNQQMHRDISVTPYLRFGRPCIVV